MITYFATEETCFRSSLSWAPELEVVVRRVLEIEIT